MQCLAGKTPFGAIQSDFPIDQIFGEGCSEETFVSSWKNSHLSSKLFRSEIFPEQRWWQIEKLNSTQDPCEKLRIPLGNIYKILVRN